jgi:integrase
MSIIIRAGKYYLRRRVPAQYSTVEARKELWVSLKTDSKTIAHEKAGALWETLVSAWDAKLRGNSMDASVKFVAAGEIARSRGFTYLPVQDVADLPLEKLLERVKALQGGDKKTSLLQGPAVLGLVEKPSLKVSDALDEYWKLTRDQTFSKSKDQIRRWKNPRKKAIRNFINAVGDIKLSDISADHMLEYRAWNSDRIQDGAIIGGSANKELTQLGHVLKTVNEMKSLNLDFYLKSLKPFKEGEKKPRPPFSDKWILEKLLAPEALVGLNDEARAIFVGMVNTGYRPSEAAGLTTERIHLDGKIPYIEIAPETDRELKNETSRRTLPLAGVSLEVFQQFPGGFPRYRENSAGLSGTVNKFLTENNLRETEDHSFYSLRHNFEDRLLRAGVDERVRRDFLGHALGREKYGEGGGLEFQFKIIQSVAF